MCTTMCTQSTCVSPARYKHQHVLGVLHQSDGGKSSADQLQQKESTLVWSESHQGPNKFVKKKGVRFFFKREEEETEGRLDFLSLPMLIGLEDTSEEIGSTTVEEFKKFVELKTSI